MVPQVVLLVLGLAIIDACVETARLQFAYQVFVLRHFRSRTNVPFSCPERGPCDSMTAIGPTKTYACLFLYNRANRLGRIGAVAI